MIAEIVRALDGMINDVNKKQDGHRIIEEACSRILMPRQDTSCFWSEVTKDVKLYVFYNITRQKVLGISSPAS